MNVRSTIGNVAIQQLFPSQCQFVSPSQVLENVSVDSKNTFNELESEENNNVLGSFSSK